MSQSEVVYNHFPKFIRVWSLAIWDSFHYKTFRLHCLLQKDYYMLASKGPSQLLISLPSTVQTLYSTVRALFSTVTVLSAHTRHLTNIVTITIWNTSRYKENHVECFVKKFSFKFL